jgi:hypothetical protein
MFSNQQILVEKSAAFYNFLKSKKGENEFLFTIINKEFDKNIEFEYGWFIVWFGVGKDWWKITDDYKIILNETE